jgi:hypothetical protein
MVGIASIKGKQIVDTKIGPSLFGHYFIRLTMDDGTVATMESSGLPSIIKKMEVNSNEDKNRLCE